MSRVLNAPSVTGAPRSLLAVPASFDDVARRAIEEASRQAAEQARRDGYERGRREAEAQQVVAAQRASEHVSKVLLPRLQAAADELAALRRERAQADVELALAIAETVIGKQPGPDAAELAGMVRQAVAHLDEPELTVRVHPDVADDLTRLLGGALDGVDIVLAADPACPPDEARVAGRWGRAEISRRHALDAVHAVLADASHETEEAAA